MEAPKQVFVYGKWVDDVHVVDYDAISMLNVSATQELARQVETLQKRVTELETENARLKTITSDVKQLQSQMIQLESWLTRQKPTIKQTNLQ